MRLNPILFVALSLVVSRLNAAPEASLARRIFDFTPVSESNPIVATIGKTIEIPVSEYLGFKNAEKPNAVTDPADLRQKKAVLEALINEYLLVEEASRLGADKLPGFTKRMEYTQTILLSEFLSVQEVDSKAKSMEEYNRLLKACQDRLVEAATIDVYEDAYGQLKKAAKAADAASKASLGPVVDTPEQAGARIRAIAEKTDDVVLAKYVGKQVTVRQMLSIYAQQRMPRPRLETTDDLMALLKPVIVMDLMAAEARKEGMEALPEFQTKLIENRNALLRMHMHGLIEAQTTEALNAVDREQRMENWHKQNAERYAVETAGVKTIPSYTEVREQVEGDYSVYLIERLMADKIRALRQTHPVKINDDVLRGL